MSHRPIYSRPRTRVYNANYDIGQSYYRSALDRLDRKYSGRPLSPPPRAPQVNPDLLERHQRAFTEEDLPSARRRAEQHITEDNPFDLVGNRRRRPLSTSFELEDGFDEELSNSLRRLRASKQRASRVIDDVDLESTVNKINYNRMIDRTDKLLDSVGLNEKTARSILSSASAEDDSSNVSRSANLRRRVVRMTATASEESSANDNSCKWSAIMSPRQEESAASFRAKASRARLQDLEDEMEALSERQVARERRVAGLRAMLAENAEENEAMDSAIKSVHARVEKKALAY